MIMDLMSWYCRPFILLMGIVFPSHPPGDAGKNNSMWGNFAKGNYDFSGRAGI